MPPERLILCSSCRYDTPWDPPITPKFEHSTPHQLRWSPQSFQLHTLRPRVLSQQSAERELHVRSLQGLNLSFAIAKCPSLFIVFRFAFCQLWFVSSRHCGLIVYVQAVRCEQSDQNGGRERWRVTTATSSDTDTDAGDPLRRHHLLSGPCGPFTTFILFHFLLFHPLLLCQFMANEEGHRNLGRILHIHHHSSWFSKLV